MSLPDQLDSFAGEYDLGLNKMSRQELIEGQRWSVIELIDHNSKNPFNKPSVCSPI